MVYDFVSIIDRQRGKNTEKKSTVISVNHYRRICECERWTAAVLVHATKIRLFPLADISTKSLCVSLCVCVCIHTCIWRVADPTDN